MATKAPNDIRDQVVSYVKHNAEKDNDAIRDLVQQGHGQLLNSIAGLSDEQAAFKPGPDEWSVLEVLRHVVGSKRGIARRCSVLARGEASANFEPADEVRAFASLAEATEAAVKAHEAMVEFFDSLSEASNTERTYDHSFVGPLNCREWAVFQRIHEGDHTGQIEKIKASKGFPSA